MATSYPQSTQTFQAMTDISAVDAPKVQQFIEYMNAGNITQANAVLETIDNYETKLVTASYLNTITDTCVAVQEYFSDRYSNGYIVSATKPTAQDTGDFWFKVVT